MGLIVTRSQPQGLARVDRRNQVNSGLVGVYSAATPTVDVVDQASFVADGGFASSFNNVGRTSVFDGSTTGQKRTYTSQSNVGLSFLAIVKTNTTSGTRNVCSVGTGTAYAAQLRQDNGDWSFYVGSTSDVLAGESAGVATGQTQILVGTCDGTNIRFYRNGVLKQTTAIGSALRTITDWKIGEDNFGTKQAWLGDINLVAYWQRGLTSNEVTALSANPWQIFQSPPRRQFAAAAAGGALTASGSPTDSPDTSSGSGSLTSVGSLVRTDSSDTSVGSASLTSVASGLTTDSADSSSAVGAVGNTAVASGNATDSLDTSAGSGSLQSTAIGATTDQPDTASGTGAVGSSALVSGSPTDQPDTSAASAKVSSTASGAVTDAPDTLAGAAFIVTTAVVSGSPADVGDSLTAQGFLTSMMAGSATDAADTLLGYAFSGDSIPLPPSNFAFRSGSLIFDTNGQVCFAISSTMALTPNGVTVTIL